jgi:hypothetical protein
LPYSDKVQAVRGVFRYSQSGEAVTDPCPGGAWTDIDAISITTLDINSTKTLEEPTTGGEDNTETKKRRGGHTKRKYNEN